MADGLTEAVLKHAGSCGLPGQCIQEETMDIAQIVTSQYFAALTMLEEAIVKCPDDLWNTPEPPNPFYQIAYHALFYCHLYIQMTSTDFTVWDKHIEGHESFGLPGHPGAPAPKGGDPYAQEDVLEYLTFCRNQVKTIAPTLDWETESGFEWLPFGKLELQFYSIRHIQGHAGELAERLSAMRGIEVGWTGMGSTD